MILAAKALLALAAFCMVVFLALSDLDLDTEDESVVISIGGLLVVLFGFVAGALQ